MRLRLTVAVAALLMSAAAASADSLRWSWSMSVVALSGNNTLFAADSTDPTKGYTFRFDPIYADDPGPIVSPTNPTTATIGIAGFRYFYQDGYPFNWEPTAAPADPNAGKFKLTINATDVDSGDTGTKDFIGTLGFHTENGKIVPDVSFDTAYVSWDLGMNRYDITLTAPYDPTYGWRWPTSDWTMRPFDQPPPGGGGTGGGQTDGGETGGEVPGNGGGGMGNPVETPEPGTLILGGIALAGGIGAWMRKRRM